MGLEKRGRGRPRGKTAPDTVLIRAHIDFVGRLDAWSRRSAEQLSRPDALDKLIEAANRWLKLTGAEPV